MSSFRRCCSLRRSRRATLAERLACQGTHGGRLCCLPALDTNGFPRERTRGSSDLLPVLECSRRHICDRHCHVSDRLDSSSFVPAGSPDVEFTAAFSSAPGLENTRVSYSPTHIATVVEGSTSHTFNTFVVTIAREGTSRRLQFDATNYPPTGPENTFSVFIRQAADMSSNPFPHGFAATPPTFSVWGDHPLSSMDLGHVKLASVSFLGPCVAPR